MAPKAKKGAGASKAKVEEERAEPLQAVVFADSFETKFAPFTLERPRTLLPLANTPLIEYTLEFLANSGVEEVILYCGNHTDQVEEYLGNSKWLRDTAPFSVDVIRSDARSVGDAMRDLDQKQLITGDFICVYGDVIANISMEPAMAAHKARREKNKKSIMTTILREAGDSQRQKAQLMRPAFIIDPASERCVHYEQIRPQQTSRLEIPEEVLKEHDELEIREDLVDCGIDICTPEVLAQYTDNFDWQMPRRGFMYGVLKDYETNQLMIHTHITKDGYANRAKNLQAYDEMSRDVMARWTYPFCPDTNLLEDHSYQLQKGNVYKEDGVVLARSSNLNGKCVLGRATSVGDGAVISNAVIGRRCVIGKRARIDGAYIWDDVRIADDAVIGKAIIANEASIGAKSNIQSGALVSFGVSIADGTVVDGRSRITKDVQEEHDDDDDEQTEGLLPPDIDDIADQDSVSALGSEEEDDAAESLDDHRRRGSSRSGSFASLDSNESRDTRRQAADFHHEATTSIVDALQKGEDVDTIQLEFRSLRLSTNAEDRQVRRAVAVSLMKRIAGLVESGLSPKDAVSKVITPYKGLVQAAVITGKDVYDEQVEFLLFVQADLVHRQQGDKILLFACYALVDNDLVEAEGVEGWWNDTRSTASQELVDVRKQTEQLVDALAADDDEDESEDDSD